LVLLGVVGGALGFGLVGIFLGPALLAIGYSLVQEWASDAAQPPEQAALPHDTDLSRAGEALPP
jgi:predicted PurR-regulated permease PerM